MLKEKAPTNLQRNDNFAATQFPHGVVRCSSKWTTRTDAAYSLQNKRKRQPRLSKNINMDKVISKHFPSPSLSLCFLAQD